MWNDEEFDEDLPPPGIPPGMVIPDIVQDTEKAVRGEFNGTEEMRRIAGESKGVEPLPVLKPIEIFPGDDPYEVLRAAQNFPLPEGFTLKKRNTNTLHKSRKAIGIRSLKKKGRGYRKAYYSLERYLDKETGRMNSLALTAPRICTTLTLSHIMFDVLRKLAYREHKCSMSDIINVLLIAVYNKEIDYGVLADRYIEELGREVREVPGGSITQAQVAEALNGGENLTEVGQAVDGTHLRSEGHGDGDGEDSLG